MTDETASEIAQTPNEPIIPPEVLQQLLATTSGTVLDRERLAAQLRNVLLAATVADNTETPGAKTNHEEATRPNGDTTRPDGMATAATTGHRHETGPALTIRGPPVPLPKFTGYRDKQSPQEFLDRYGEYCDICGIPPERRAQMLPASLEGSAKQWWRFTGGFPDWDTLVKEFTEEFTPVDHTFQLKRELEQRTQHPAENLRQFIHTIAEFYDRIGEPVSDAEKVERVRRQMHPTFQDLAANMQFANLKEMAKAAGQIMERAWYRQRYAPPPPRTNQLAADLAFVDEAHTQQPGTLIAAATRTTGQHPEWPLHPAAVLASQRDFGMHTLGLRAEASEWMPTLPPTPVTGAGQQNNRWQPDPLQQRPPAAPPTQQRRVYRRDNNNVVCRRCGGLGHLARECATGRTRDQRRCFICRQPGHVQAQCPGNERA